MPAIIYGGQPRPSDVSVSLAAVGNGDQKGRVARAQGHRHYVPWKIGVWRERAGHGARLDGLAFQRGLIRPKGHEENLVPGIGAVRRELPRIRGIEAEEIPSPKAELSFDLF